MSFYDPKRSCSLQSYFKIHSEERLSKTPDVKEIDVSSFAKAIERLLYAKASQDNNPLVLENLDERIHTLMKAIRKRRVRKQGGHRNRMETLVHILGQDLSRNICKVVTEVKLLRLQRAATACGACMRNGTCSMAPREGIADLPPLMPEPVQRLFFNTRLIEATEKTPVSQLKNQDWDTMLQEARNNIDEYHVWTKAQRKSNSPPAA